MSRQEESWERFCNQYLAKIINNPNHIICKKADFGKMSAKWGFGFIEYIKMAYEVWQKDVMTEEEFKEYNGIPDEYFKKLNIRST